MIHNSALSFYSPDKHMEGFKRRLATASTLQEKYLEGFHWFIQHLASENRNIQEYELFFFTSKELALHYFKAYRYTEDQHNFIESLDNAGLVTLEPSDTLKYFYYDYGL